MNESRPKFCISCGTALKEVGRFCPHCGHRLDSAVAARLTAKQMLVIVLCGLSVCAFGWTLSGALAGKPPTGHYKKDGESAAQWRSEDAAMPEDPAIVELKKQADAQPENVELWVKYAQLLAQKIRENEKPDAQLVFQAIDALRHILDHDPKNAFALIAMADLSFEQQAFAKAVQFYEQYLEIEPDDVSARSRYASTLSFLTQYDKAIAQLELALKKDPKNFNARAYMAITYAQKGDFKKAREFGDEALKYAPSDEAKIRFSEFIQKLQDESKNPSQPAGSANDPASPADAAVTQPLSLDAQHIIDALKKSPIAGPRLIRSETQGSELKVYLRQFPMSQMPPFAKEKFFGSLRDAAGINGSIKSVVFYDEDSKEQLDKLELDTQKGRK